MNRTDKNAAASTSLTSAGRLRARLSCVALVAALCLFLLPTAANAACGRYGVPGLKLSVILPPVAHADYDFSSSLAADPTIVGLWHVIYTNGADQSTFNDTFDTWHSDGTEFESAFLAPAGGDVCVGVWKKNGRGVTLHHVGWLFNPSTPTATATNTFTLDEEISVDKGGKAYTGTFTFKIWNLDGTPTPVVVTGTIAATRITVD